MVEINLHAKNIEKIVTNNYPISDFGTLTIDSGNSEIVLFFNNTAQIEELQNNLEILKKKFETHY